MLKRLALFAAISVLMVVHVIGQPNRTKDGQDKPPVSHQPTTVSIDPNDNHSGPQKTPQNSGDEGFNLRGAIKRPEWWATAIALGTMFLIFWQSKATATVLPEKSDV
jgi:hypothetical protein